MAQDSTDINETIGSLDDYILLGRSGLRISPLCLGTLTFGESFGIGSNYEVSKEVFDYYFEKGGNFFDTANMYNFGESERFLGEYIGDKRSQVVLANSTALSPNVKYNPNAGGNHRKSLVENIDASIKRLGTGYVDLLYVHIWEYRTPIEEVMRSLDDVVRSGKVLYVAISDTPAWVFSRANTIAEFRGWSPFIGLQTRYNLLDRSMEYDIQSACAELDVQSVIKAKNTGDMRDMRNNSIIRLGSNETNWKILDEVKAIATEINRTPAQVALNWIAQKPGITSPLIGARTKTQLVENLKALEFKLTPKQMERLDNVSASNEIPFPYSITMNLNKYLGKGIQIPDKYKALFEASKKSKEKY
ncbi:20422_t:CDS:10 [Cetraspora pellucida]|uniref:20422_t:CDS:1 n=1 Tax=Cetraspora pellucida TaxID=1433469 RepID=A0A9N9AIZ2_9GLOM|nr:20422_t:CDS:10 [Cetraspora pellucida]